MKLIRFIGDVHGKYEPYKRLIRDFPRSIQVGDLGVGFKRTQGPNAGEIYANPPHYAMVAADHKFIRGNHDNPEECKKHSQWIPDGHVDDNMMFCGGAVSIDRDRRTEGYTYWSDEELSIKELDVIVTDYLRVQPKIMVTHDCPEVIAEEMVRRSDRWQKLDPKYSSRSRQAFQHMWSAHRPKLWIFGHWHVSAEFNVNDTRFICLAELEHRDIDVEDV